MRAAFLRLAGRTRMADRPGVNRLLQGASVKPFLTHALLVASLTLCSATGWAAEAKTPSTWEQIKDYSHEQKKAAMAEGRKLIRESDKQAAAIEKQIRRSTGEAKAAHEQNLKELRAKRQEAQAQLAQMRKASSNAWDATKQGFGNAYQELHQAYTKATQSADAAKK